MHRSVIVAAGGRPLLTAQEKGEAYWCRSLDAEDRKGIPGSFREKKNELNRNNPNPIQFLLSETLELGTEQFDGDWRKGVFTIEKRKGTFTAEWVGPPPDVMAECGFFRVSRDSAECYCCAVKLRGLQRNTCVWTLHRDFAPFCRHLQRAVLHESRIGCGRSPRLRHSSTIGIVNPG